MVSLPTLNEAGDLPAGVWRATLDEVLHRFGSGTTSRRRVADRLRRVHTLAMATGQVRHFIIFGSFVTARPDPNDVDVFLMMEDGFDPKALGAAVAPVFDHAAAQDQLGASIFWMRRAAALDGEDVEITHWQWKRDHTRRGIIEVVPAQTQQA